MCTLSAEQWEKAHSIYQRLGDTIARADLIEQAGSLLAQNGRLQLLVEWLDAYLVRCCSRVPLSSPYGVLWP